MTIKFAGRLPLARSRSSGRGGGASDGDDGAALLRAGLPSPPCAASPLGMRRSGGHGKAVPGAASAKARPPLPASAGPDPAAAPDRAPPAPEGRDDDAASLATCSSADAPKDGDAGSLCLVVSRAASVEVAPCASGRSVGSVGSVVPPVDSLERQLVAALTDVEAARAAGGTEEDGEREAADGEEEEGAWRRRVYVSARAACLPLTHNPDPNPNPWQDARRPTPRRPSTC